MSNVLGTQIATLISARAIDFIREMIPAAIRYYVDIGNKDAQYGQSTITHIPSLGAAYDASSGYSAPDVGTTNVTVAVNKWKSASFGFSAAELNATDSVTRLVSLYAPQAANKLATAFMADFASVLTVSNGYNDTVVAASSHDPDTISAARKRLNAAGAPTVGRMSLQNGDVFENVTADSRITSVDSNPSAYDRNVEAPASYRWGGFTNQEYPALPNNSEDLTAAYLAPGAVAGVTGIPNDANRADFPSDAPATVKAIPVMEGTEPGVLSIPLLLREQKTQAGGYQFDLTFVYGFAKGNVACGEIILGSE